MWKYNHTDELFHSGMSGLNYIDLTPDAIAHFKYIKRVKLPNGKYRYYYDDSYLKSAEKDFKNADDRYKKIKKQEEEIENNALKRAIEMGRMDEEMKKAGKSDKERYDAWLKSERAKEDAETVNKTLGHYNSKMEAYNKRNHAEYKYNKAKSKDRRVRGFANATSKALNILNGTHDKKKKRK